MRYGRLGAFIGVAAVLAGVAGCPVFDSRTNNQGGGSILSGGTKLASGNIGEMNPDEWQIVVDNAPTLAPQIATQYGVDLTSVDWPVLSDDQAQMIVDYLAANGFQTLTQLQAALTAGTLPEPPQALLDLMAPYLTPPAA